MLIDTHAHLNFSAYRDDVEKVIKRCSDAKVGVINVGSQFSTSQRAVEMAEKYENMYAAIGLHPIHLSPTTFSPSLNSVKSFSASGKMMGKVVGDEFDTRNEKFDKEKYRKLAESKKVVAIGETGLDIFHNPHNLEKQIKTFEEEISLAIELNLPIIIHCRKANKEIVEILEEKKKEYGDKLRGVVHCFSGKLSQARQYINLGFLIGFNGIITFARDYDKVVREIDLKYILVETDCPYLTPIPHRGERNEPSYVKYVAKKIAEIKKVDFDEVAKVTTENARRLFRI